MLNSFMSFYMRLEPYQGIIFLAFFALLLYLLFRKIAAPIFQRIALRTKGKWDDLLVENKFLTWISHIIPAVTIAIGLPYALDKGSWLFDFLYRANNVYFIIVVYLIISSMLSAFSASLQLDPQKQKLPIHGLVQAVNLLGFLICSVLVLSQLTQKSPILLLSGLGALAAVFMLVFKDPILGFVAGIQITTLDLVRTGDWIEMPKHNADGFVIDVSLTSVRIRNWDNTISVVPAYELVSSSFKNWRGMSDSGGRRIKRSISIDVQTVHFLNAEEIQELLKIKRLRPYLESKLREIDEYNQKELTPEDYNALANGRRLTNIGTFRAYCEAYLRSHSGIHQSMTLLVRHLQPEAQGQPIEIYAFTNDTGWVAYESIQADIFDHIIAVLPSFKLRMFQQPTGEDLRQSGGRVVTGS